MSKPQLTITWHIYNLKCKHCYAAGEQFKGEVGIQRIIDFYELFREAYGC